MSMKRLNLNDLAQMLDPTIKKGEELEQKDLIKSENRRKQIRKALSHNPFNPVDMGLDSEYYNPYKYNYEDGAFMPHSPEYWYDQGKSPEKDEYNTVKQFYGRKVEIQQTFNRFADLKRSLDEGDLIKAGLPVGTVHEWKGQKFKKVAEGDWKPIAANSYEGKEGESAVGMRDRLMHQNPRERQFASQALEQHASQSSKIKQVLDQKMKEQDIAHTAKQAAVGHVQEALKFIHGDKIPTEVKHKLNQFAEKTDSEHPHKQALNKLGESFGGQKPHTVNVKLKIGGKQIDHQFTNVLGRNESDVMTKVKEELAKKLPNAQVSGMKVEKQAEITPELQEKIKKLGKGQGRQVDLGEDEVKALLKSGKFALISAGINPANEEDKKLDKGAVSKRYESLRQDLKEGGYAYSKVTGHYGGKEDSYLVMVHDADKDHIKELGKKYNQDSVIYSEGGKHEMHFTTGDKDGQHHKGEGISPNAKEAEDYYSEIQLDNGKKFKFSLNFDFDNLHNGESKQTGKSPHATSEENMFLSFIHSFDLIKGGLPIGTVHEWKGQRFQKMGEGDWRPVGTGKKMGAAPDMSEGKRASKIEEIESALADKIEEAASKKKKMSPKDSSSGDKKESQPAKEKQKFQGTKADYGRPDNGMGPPPPENEAFVKRGAELEIDEVQGFIEKFKQDYVGLQNLGSDLKAAGAAHFGNRLKDKLSLYNKMHGRLKERSLNTTTDVIGARALASSIDNQQAVLSHMKENYEMVEVEDSSAKGRPDGYRAIHVLFKTDTGKISELQIKTHRQQIYSGYTHDTIYKPKPELAEEFGKAEDGRPKNREVANFLNQLSDYLYSLDQGEKDSPEKRPKEPAILLENGYEFPWKEVEKLEKEDFSSFNQEEKEGKKKFKQFEKQEKGKVKHFVVVRSPSKENLEIKEFDSFDKADAYVKKNSPKHKGEMPMGYSDSKEEFLRVFSEYRPQGWE
jgi:hypothetical protein